MSKVLLLFLFSLNIFAGGFISGKEARSLVKKGAVLLDVRTFIEYKITHIPGAVRISYSDISEKIKEVDKLVKGKKDHPIVVYCQSGGRSSIAQDTLNSLGYKNVYNLGGRSRWYDDCLKDECK